jgi:hypothetical protein
VGVPTFTRATVATVTDFEGLIKNVKSGEARFEGARRVENSITNSENLTAGGGWTVVNATSVIGATAPDGTPTAFTFTATNAGGQIWKASTISTNKTVVSSFWIRRVSGTGNVRIDSDAGTHTVVTVTSTWKRFSELKSSPVTSFFSGIFLDTSGDVVEIWHPQLEDVTGQANQNPSEYVSTNVKTSAPYHGANVDGVKYFTTYNGNTVASNVVTEATGGAIPDATLHGYVAEGARTNLALQSEAFHHASWSKIDITTGVATTTSPNGAQGGQLITTGTDGTGKIISNVGMTSVSDSTYTTSVYVKRGNTDWVYLNNANVSGTDIVRQWYNIGSGVLGSSTVGGTGVKTNATITDVGNGWYRLTLSCYISDTSILITILNPTGDLSVTRVANATMYLWGAQRELGSFASSYILTTTASVTRNADVLSYPTAGNYSNSAVSAYTESIYSRTVATYGSTIDIGDGTTNNRIELGGLTVSNTAWVTSIMTGGVSQLESSSNGAMSPYVFQKLAMFASPTSAKGFLNGTQKGNVATNISLPQATRILIGNDFGNRAWYGTIRNVKIWKKALTDAQLTNMTSTNASVSQSAVKKTTVGADGSSFQADLKNTLDLQAGVGKPTFTRATIATVTDFEGLIKTVKSGEARFEGARRVENLFTFSEAFDNAAWTKNNGGVASVPTVTENYATAPNGTMTAERAQFALNGGTASTDISRIQKTITIPTGNKAVYSVWIKSNTGSSYVMTLRVSLATAYITVTPTWTRFIISGISADPPQLFLRGAQTPTNSDSADISIWGAQLEDVTGQANQNPSEYVSTNVLTSAPYHGANVDGVKYFTTYNGNTVASNVVTEATGAPIPDATLHGYVAEGARTNMLEYSEQFFQSSVWTKANMSIGNATTTAPDGKNAGSKIIPIGGTAQFYILNDSSISSGTSYTQSIYAKAGGYNYIQIASSAQFDLTTTWVNYDLSTGLIGNKGVGSFTSTITTLPNGWYRISITATATGTGTGRFVISVLNTDINSRVPAYTSDGTSGIYLWGAQLEAATFASSYIPTTTASVARNADVLTYPTAGNVDVNAYTAYAEPKYYSSGSIGGHILSMRNSATGGIVLRINTGGKVGLYDGTARDYLSNIDPTVLNNVAIRFSSLGANGFANGLAGTASVATSPMVNFNGKLAIGSDVTSTATTALFGTIRNVKIWKKALTDTQLTNMTSTNTAVSQSAVKKTIVNASQNTKLTSGLVGLWSFNGTDISGTTVYDRSGQGNNGTITGGVTKAIGKIGQGLSFDGVDDYVNIGSLHSTEELTLSVWIYTNTVNGGTRAVLSDTAGANRSYQLEVNRTDARLTFVHAATVILTNNTDILPNTWYHVVAVRSGTSENWSVRIYLNGNLDASIATAVNPTLPTGNASIGTDLPNAGRFFTGKIDEVRMYNRALSATEVKQLYNLGR